MTFSSFRRLIYSDLYRIYGKSSFLLFVKELFFGEGFQYVFWLRLTKTSSTVPSLKYWLHPIGRLVLRRLRYKLGISIPWNTVIGSGFYIGHFGGIVVNGRAIIGDNCNISHCVTIGKGNRGPNSGVPRIGDNVYIGPGAKVVGAVRIGDRVAVGANCVVTKDIPDDAVVVGIPGRVISFKGSCGYVNRVDYVAP